MKTLSFICITLCILLPLVVVAEEKCASTVNSSWVYTKNSILLVRIVHFKEILCQRESVVPGANVELQLLSESGEILFKLQEYLPYKHIAHGQDKNGVMDSVIIEDWTDHKIIKFPRLKILTGVRKYIILDIKERKIKAQGEIRI